MNMQCRHNSLCISFGLTLINTGLSRNELDSPLLQTSAASSLELSTVPPVYISLTLTHMNTLKFGTIPSVHISFRLTLMNT